MTAQMSHRVAAAGFAVLGIVFLASGKAGLGAAFLALAAPFFALSFANAGTDEKKAG
jgi:hypothetical protein